MALPRLAASGAMSVRIQSAIAVAMAQRRIAAGFTETWRLSGSTTASSRTRSSPPQPPTPWMSGMLGAMAISSDSASRQAEGGGGAAALRRSAGLSAVGGRGGWLAAGFSGSAAGASAGRGFGNGTEAGWIAPRSFGGRCPNRSPQGLQGGGPSRRRSRIGLRAKQQQGGRGGNHGRPGAAKSHKAICGVLSPR